MFRTQDGSLLCVMRDFGCKIESQPYCNASIQILERVDLEGTHHIANDLKKIIIGSCLCPEFFNAYGPCADGFLRALHRQVLPFSNVRRVLQTAKHLTTEMYPRLQYSIEWLPMRLNEIRVSNQIGSFRDSQSIAVRDICAFRFLRNAASHSSTGWPSPTLEGLLQL